MDAYSPIPAVILAIDPGATSGWALYSADRCIASGIAKTHEQRVMAIEIAQTEETRAKLRLIVVAEKWSPGGRWYTATMTGMLTKPSAGPALGWNQLLASTLEGNGPHIAIPTPISRPNAARTT